MKGNTFVQSWRVQAALLVLAAVLFPVIGVFRASYVSARREPNNPQDFHLWSTGATYTYTFRYDPRAADVWSFKSGGDARFFLRGLTNSSRHSNR
jgi:hypothetical protein